MVEPFHVRQANSQTGVPGVRRTARRIRRRHDKNTFYEVTVYIAEVWLEPGRDGKRPRKPEAGSSQFRSMARTVPQRRAG